MEKQAIAPGCGVENALMSAKAIKVKELLNYCLLLFGIISPISAAIAGLNRMGIYIYYGISLDLFTYDFKDSFIIIVKYTVTWFGLLVVPYIISFNKGKLSKSDLD